VRDDVLQTLLRDAGVTDAGTLPVGATIRPPMASVSTDDTLAAPRPGTRAPPKLSVDVSDPSGRVDGSPRASGRDLEVLRPIGEGGMGCVLLVRQHSLARDVAVKTTKPGASETEERALLTEGVVTGRLEHPGIVPIHALGLDDHGRPVIVMKRIEGVTWTALLVDADHSGWEGWDGERGDRLSGHLQILSQVCNALHFAHSRGIVHRDVKPDNVLIGRYGDVYLADWGVAGELGACDGRLCGTPTYMAPEMVASGVVDARTDVYLLGATLHEILTGEPRHAAPNIIAALASAAASAPFVYGDDVPAELGALANAACHREPTERPESAQAFREALAHHHAHRQSAALATEAQGRLERLHPLLAIDEPSDDERRDIDRLLAEARFGLEQAIVQWSGNEAAQSALARLEQLLEARRARSAELERLARERDPRISARARAVGVAGFAALGIAMAIGAVVVVDRPTPGQLLVFPTVLAVAALGAALSFRRSVLRTAFNRQFLATVLVGLGLMFAGRATGLVTDIEPAVHFARDAFVWAAVLIVGSVAYLRWALWPALVFTVAGVVCMLVPEQALRVFAGATSLAVLLGAVLAWRGSRAP
jgi:serine/threonine-protein kinase